MIYIYSLSNSVTKEIRYIGKTKNLKSRLGQHKHNANRKRNHLECWVNELLSKNIDISMEIVDICLEEEWNDFEIYWIEQFRVWGFDLVNTSKGGISFFKERAFKSMPKKNLKKVIKYDLDGNFIAIYDSITIASGNNEVLRKHISSCCLKKRKSTGGHMWEYYTKGYLLKITKYTKEIGKTLFKKGHHYNNGRKASEETKLKQSIKKRVKVKSIKTGKIFESMEIAAIYYDISVKTLRSQLFFNTKTALVKYYDESKNKQL